MTIEQRIKFLDAGYSKEEIESFSDPAPAPQQDPDPQPGAPAASQPGNPEAPDQGQQGLTVEARLDALTAALQGLVAAQQAQNIKGTGYGGTQLTPEQALAQGVFGNK